MHDPDIAQGRRVRSDLGENTETAVTYRIHVVKDIVVNAVALAPARSASGVREACAHLESARHVAHPVESNNNVSDPAKGTPIALILGR